MRHLRHLLVVCGILGFATNACAGDHVDITWMSIANLHMDFGNVRLVADGYITRLPQKLFFGGGGGLAQTRRSVRPDQVAVREVFDAIGGRSAVNWLITGHSHFDHSFDTPVWARLSGAPIIGAPTTCLQVQAAKIPASRCRAVLGGERIVLADGVTMYVIRWNHSGDSAKNPEQHDARELSAAPMPMRDGGLRAGVAEDFPNGGGGRAYLFVLDAPGGALSILFQDSAGAADLATPIVVDGRDYGAPIDNLRHALQAAGLEHIDLWVGTGGAEVATLVLPVIRPVAYLPVHWDGLFGAFKAGPAEAFSDPALEMLLAGAGVKLIRPRQYMDKWRLDRTGIRELDNRTVKSRLGLH